MQMSAGFACYPSRELEGKKPNPWNILYQYLQCFSPDSLIFRQDGNASLASLGSWGSLWPQKQMYKNCCGSCHGGNTACCNAKGNVADFILLSLHKCCPFVSAVFNYLDDISPATRRRFCTVSVKLHKQNIWPGTRENFPNYLSTGTLKEGKWKSLFKNSLPIIVGQKVINELNE